jgi:ribosomal protein RSM22 (predicted rRNA methylase)
MSLKSLPEDLQLKIDQIVGAISPSILRKARETLSSTYREKLSSHSIFSDPAQRLSYLATRLPATYAAVSAVLEELLQRQKPFQCKSLLDLGAGPGTASLAAFSFFPDLEEVVLIEKSLDAIHLGKELISNHQWICKDLTDMEKFPKADLAILSYSLGEIKAKTHVLERLWNSDIDTIAIIEPGTPFGYETILEARNLFLRLNGNIIAPCPHSQTCPLTKGDWCHFSVRLERTKLHRLLKEGSLGYEDEKFSYLIISKNHRITPDYARVLRHPFKGSGFTKLFVCTNHGSFEERTISRKDKELYRASKDIDWGDVL